MGDLYKRKNETADQVIYICPECGCQMIFEGEGLLVCPECGISMSADQFEP